MTLKKYLPLLALPLIVSLSACNGSDDETTNSDLGDNVNTPAIPVLKAETTLHVFSVQDFDIDPTDVNPTRAFIANFSMPSETREPEDDEEDTINDLGWTEDKWNDSTRSWATVNSPELDSRFDGVRPYRILNENNLESAKSVLNRPIFEAIDDNIFERYMAVTFVWDMDNLTDETGEEVDGKEIGDYQTFRDFLILPNAEVWGDDVNFSAGAKIFGATRSIAEDVVVVESLPDGNAFTIGAAQIVAENGKATLEQALLPYALNGTNRIAYTFTVDYGTVELNSAKDNTASYVTEHTVYLTFDTVSKMAKIFIGATGTAEAGSVTYTEHPDRSFIELNTDELDVGARALAKIPPTFKPVIIGPFSATGGVPSDSANNAYFIGKRYIKTDDNNRLNLNPILFLNPTAKNDVFNAFDAYQDERYEDLK